MFEILDICTPKDVKGAHSPRNEHPWVENNNCCKLEISYLENALFEQILIDFKLAKINCKQEYRSVILFTTWFVPDVEVQTFNY